jgi:hypothetical protein
MGTAQATFVEVVRGGATGSDVTGSGPEVFSRVCACANGSYAIYALVGPFRGSDVSHVTPKEGSLGCAHAPPKVVVSPLFFGCFRICCVVLHVRVLTVLFLIAHLIP